MAVCDILHAEMARVEAELQKLLAVRNSLRQAAGVFAGLPDDVAGLLPIVPPLPTAPALLAAAQSCPWLAALLPPGFGPGSVVPLSLIRRFQAALKAQLAATLRGPIGRGVRLLSLGVAALAPVSVLLNQLQQLDQCVSALCGGVSRAERWLNEFQFDSFGHPLIAASEQAQVKAARAKRAIDEVMARVEAWA